MTTIGKMTVTTPTDREMQVTRVFDAPRKLLFDAWTRPELLKGWLFGPDGWSLAVCEIDLRVGGAYRFVWRSPDKKDMGMGGVYREIAPPERIVMTELFDVDWTGGETLATIALTDQGGKTTLTQTVLYSSREARDGALGTGMEEGMAAAYDRLAELLPSMPAQASSRGAA